MMEVSRESVFQNLKKHKAELHKYHVKKIGLFGSVLRGNSTESSDIDLIVEFEEGEKTYENFIELAFYLDEIFQKKVELLTIEGLSPFLRNKILKEAYFESI